MLYATLAHLIGRALGRRGAFYEVMGGALAAIDGYTGTMPPYERAIVFAPREPAAFAQAAFERIGARMRRRRRQRSREGESPRRFGSASTRALIERALLDNPHGNGDEQTPLVVLKWRGRGSNPLFESDP